MSRKIISLIAVFLLIGGLPLFAASPEAKNVIYLSGSGGPEGTTPPVELIRVRYSLQGVELTNAKLNSGDVVVWDTNSADGFSVSACVANFAMSYAGVMVTDVETAESSTIRAGSRNWGWMAVRGYCLARVDTSQASSGSSLQTGGRTLVRAFATTEGTSPTSGETGLGAISMDIGVLLNDTGTDGLMPVYLN